MLHRPHFALNSARTLIARAAGSLRVALWRLPDSIAAREVAAAGPTAALEGRAPDATFDVEGVGVAGLFFATDTLLVVISEDGQVCAHDLGAILDDADASAEAEPPIVWQLRLARKITTTAAHRDDGTLTVVAGDDDGQLHLLISVDGARPEHATGSAHADAVLEVALSPDGTRIASSARDRKILIWPAMPQAPLDEPADDPPAEDEDSDVSPEEVLDFFSVADDDAEPADAEEAAHDEDDEDGEDDTAPALLRPSRVLTGAEGWTLTMAFSPDGARLASGAMDNGVYLWELWAEEPLRAVQFAHHGWISQVAWSPDASHIASASWDNTVGLFRGDDLSPTLCLENHRDYVASVAFGPDGRLYSASYDHTWCAWSWAEPELVGQIRAHVDWVEAVVPLDDLLLSIGSDDTMHLYRSDDLSLVGTLGVPSGAGIEIGEPVDLSEFVDSEDDASSEAAEDRGPDGILEPSSASYRDHRSTGFVASHGQAPKALLDKALDRSTAAHEEGDSWTTVDDGPPRLLLDVRDDDSPMTLAGLPGVEAMGELSLSEDDLVPPSLRPDEPEEDEGPLDESPSDPAIAPPRGPFADLGSDRTIPGYSHTDPSEASEVEDAKEEQDEQDEQDEQATKRANSTSPGAHILQSPAAEESDASDDATKVLRSPLIARNTREESEDETGVFHYPFPGAVVDDDASDDETGVLHHPIPGAKHDDASDDETGVLRYPAPGSLVGESSEDATSELRKPEDDDDASEDRTAVLHYPLPGRAEDDASEDETGVLRHPIPGAIEDDAADDETGVLRHPVPGAIEDDAADDETGVLRYPELTKDDASEDETGVLRYPGSLVDDASEDETQLRSVPTRRDHDESRDETRFNQAPIGHSRDETTRASSGTSVGLRPVKPRTPQEPRLPFVPVEAVEPAEDGLGSAVTTVQSAGPRDASDEGRGAQVFDTTLSELWRQGDLPSAPPMGILRPRPTDERPFEPAVQIRTPHRWVYGVAIDRDLRQIASCGGDDTVCVWSTEGDLLHRLRVDADGLNDVGFTPDGRGLVGCGDDGVIHLWLLPEPGKSSEKIRHARLEGHGSCVTAVGFTADGRRMVTSSYDGTARIWHLHSGECLGVLEGHEGPVIDLSVGPGRAVTVGNDGTLRVWNEKWLEIDLFEATSALLSASTNGKSICWSMANGEVLVLRNDATERLVAHHGEARAVDMRSDGAVATAGEDGAIRVYHRDDDLPAQSLSVPTSLWSVAFRGKYVLAGGDDGRVHVFRG